MSFLACTTCFGGANSVTANALSLAVLTLLGIVLFVISGFFALIYSFWKRRGLHS
ncbi:MAG: hypothetical protein HY586_01335 [Candidatus Omnitrophica bacterium]|nr:hypothetical protein [Candidatus Omnitrophota bacterium]